VDQPETGRLASEWRIPVLTDAECSRFRQLVLQATGINMRETKRALLVARLMQRLRQLGLDSFSEYYDHLKADESGQELLTFINRVTTNKTSFFREPHHFEFLRTSIIPAIRARREPHLRIWSAGCSSGEEPYSIAITVREAPGFTGNFDAHILASDIDTEMLERAKAGIYPEESLAELPLARKRAHFLRGYGAFAGSAQARAEVRNMIDFRRINLAEPAWPVLPRFDVIYCRNVIIYFSRDLQQQVIQRLAAHLKPDGYLFLGHSENLFWLRGLLVSAQPTIYRLHSGGKAS
jgi:chemotaxis protein methyltransferase CheR